MKKKIYKLTKEKKNVIGNCQNKNIASKTLIKLKKKCTSSYSP